MSKLRPAPRPPAVPQEVDEIPIGVRRAAAWSSWCRTAAASGRAWNTRLSVPAGPIRAGS